MKTNIYLINYVTKMPILSKIRQCFLGQNTYLVIFAVDFYLPLFRRTL